MSFSDRHITGTQVLILPGYCNSGPGHWQTLWEAAHPAYRRVAQRDWDHPARDEWVATLDQALQQGDGDTVLVAHSLGCLLVAHWAATHLDAQLGTSQRDTVRGEASRSGARVKAALLVAPPDPTRADFPREITGFGVTPLRPLPFRSIVVASTNDPYGSFDWAARCAAAWGSELINVGAAGHINASSGLGAWPAGHALLETLLP